MKYLVILGDGMADRPIESLGGRTPLEYAKTPKMDELAAKGEIGMVHTIPDGMKPGSDTANLSVLGYNPREFLVSVFSSNACRIRFSCSSSIANLFPIFRKLLCKPSCRIVWETYCFV